MIELYREMVTTLQAMEFTITREDANETWKAFKEKMTEDLISRASDLLIDRKEWANPPTLKQCFEDAIKEGENGSSTAGTQAEDGGFQDGAGSGETGVVDIRSGEQLEGHGNGSVPQGHDSSPGPCCRQGIVFARFQNPCGRLNQLSVFRCTCRMGLYHPVAWPIWNDQRDYIRE